MFTLSPPDGSLCLAIKSREVQTTGVSKLQMAMESLSHCAEQPASLFFVFIGLAHFVDLEDIVLKGFKV